MKVNQFDAGRRSGDARDVRADVSGPASGHRHPPEHRFLPSHRHERSGQTVVAWSERGHRERQLHREGPAISADGTVGDTVIVASGRAAGWVASASPSTKTATTAWCTPIKAAGRSPDHGGEAQPRRRREGRYQAAGGRQDERHDIAKSLTAIDGSENGAVVVAWSSGNGGRPAVHVGPRQERLGDLGQPPRPHLGDRGQH